MKKTILLSLLFSYITISCQEKTFDEIHKKWEFKTNGTIRTNPIIFKDVVLFGSEDKSLYAVNYKTGKLTWSFETGNNIYSSPIVKNNIVYFSSNDGYLYAINIETGKLKWKFEGAYVDSDPIIDGSTIYIGGVDDFYAINIEDGTKKWKFTSTGIVIDSKPTISNNFVIFRNDGGYYYALDKNNGELIWKRKTSFIGKFSSPISNHNTVFVEEEPNRLIALNASNGKEKWIYSNQDSIFYSTSRTPAIYKNIVYHTSLNSIYAIDTQTGNELWRKMNLLSKTNVGPTVYKNYLIHSNGQNIYILNPLNGAELYKLEFDKYILSKVVFVNDLFIFSAEDYIYCFEKS